MRDPDTCRLALDECLWVSDVLFVPGYPDLNVYNIRVTGLDGSYERDVCNWMVWLWEQQLLGCLLPLLMAHYNMTLPPPQLPPSAATTTAAALQEPCAGTLCFIASADCVPQVVAPIRAAGAVRWHTMPGSPC